jgi:hypothetical protein
MQRMLIDRAAVLTLYVTQIDNVAASLPTRQLACQLMWRRGRPMRV